MSLVSFHQERDVQVKQRGKKLFLTSITKEADMRSVRNRAPGLIRVGVVMLQLVKFTSNYLYKYNNIWKNNLHTIYF